MRNPPYHSAAATTVPLFLPYFPVLLKSRLKNMAYNYQL
jgi:hypothetical protein